MLIGGLWLTEVLNRKYRSVVNALLEYSGHVLFARDLCNIIAEMKGASISPKGIGKRMVWLEDLEYVERIPFTSSEALYNRCRYAYKWIPPELRG